jgi:hypothetical protein
MEQPVHRTLEKIVQTMEERLQRMGEPAVSARTGPGKWSVKEILGHLVDSALNNHQRFIRAQRTDGLRFPGYEQDAWVAAQGYAEEDWYSVVELWCALNRHLSHVIKRIPPEKLSVVCTIGESPPVSLDFLVRDYIRHLEHHLAGIDPAYRSTE